LQPDPDRVEGQRDEQRGQHRRAGTAQQRVEDGQQPGVGRDNSDGQHQVEHRTGQHQPDVEQLVAQDRDGDCRRHQRDGQQQQDRPATDQPARQVQPDRHDDGQH
jgi:hypothetical protein